MVKAYLKYEFRNNFGVITTHQSNIVFNKTLNITYSAAN